MNDLESQLREAFRGREGDAPGFDPSDAPRIAGGGSMSRKVVATDGAPGAIGPYSQGIVTDGWEETADPEQSPEMALLTYLGYLQDRLVAVLAADR